MPRSVTAEYPELMHYTTAAGLCGIVNSGCVWATHARYLNDAEEMHHFFEARLPELIRPEAKKYLDELSSGAGVAEKIEADGGVEKIVEREVQVWAERIRTFTKQINLPFIFSMAATHDSAILQNGLLSQWRGYGVDGGYALVFDSKSLDERLRVEGQRYLYQTVSWGNVFYYGKDFGLQPSIEDVAKLEQTVQNAVAKLLRGGETNQMSNFYEAVSALSCLFKHWGFSEEHELRVIAVPARDDFLKAVGGTRGAAAKKPIRSFIRGGMAVPYIELFGGSGPAGLKQPLPISRVIIGPHRDAKARAEATRLLLSEHGYKTEVVCSSIPYIGR